MNRKSTLLPKTPSQHRIQSHYREIETLYINKSYLPSQNVWMQAGALVAGVVFALTSDKGKFYISAFCGLAGVLCTFLFIPDITGLDLREGDRRWIKTVEGKGMLPRSCCTQKEKTRKRYAFQRS